MTRYKDRRPVFVEAEQFWHKGDAGVTEMYADMYTNSGPCEKCGKPFREHGVVRLRLDTNDPYPIGSIACPGDWIITEDLGDRLPRKPDKFAERYAPAKESTS